MEEAKNGSQGRCCRCWRVALAILALVACVTLACKVHTLRKQNARLREKLAALEQAGGHSAPTPAAAAPAGPAAGQDEDLTDDEVDELLDEMGN